MATRTVLRRDLADLKQRVYSLGEKCIEVSHLYSSLIESYSDNLASRLLSLKEEIKAESKELNEQCFMVLTLQQPLIKDLRFVIGTLQIVLNLEKITEHYNATVPLITDLHIIEKSIAENLSKMSNLTQELLKQSLTLYLSSNLDIAKSTAKLSSEINYLHDIIYKQILVEVGKEGGQRAQIEAQLLAIIKSVEKASDLTSNIIEQVTFIILGNKD